MNATKVNHQEYRIVYTHYKTGSKHQTFNGTREAWKKHMDKVGGVFTQVSMMPIIRR